MYRKHHSIANYSSILFDSQFAIEHLQSNIEEYLQCPCEYTQERLEAAAIYATHIYDLAKEKESEIHQLEELRSSRPIRDKILTFFEKITYN